MKIQEEIHQYKPINPKGYYELWVSALIGNSGDYRCNLMEECDAQITQSVDVDLKHYSDRRWLENYVKDLSKKCHLKMVVFGNGCCGGDNHYSLERYKEIYGSWKDMSFINDLNININAA